MSILISGGAGFIGSHTCVELLESGEDIVVVDNHDNSSPESLRRVRELTGKDFPEYTLDVRDEEGLRRVFSTHKIDAVIHFAGLKAVGESVALPLKYYDNNLNGAITLCRVMDEFDCRRLVFSSSATVYGEGNPSPLSEDMPLGETSNPYGETKKEIERILRDVCKANADWSVVILRYFNPIGAHPSGRIGENPNGIPNNLMPYVSQVAIGKLPQLSVYGDDYDTPDGTGVRDYIHVMDLARGHVCAVKYAREHHGAEAINLGTGCGYSVLNMVHAFEKASGRPVPYAIRPRRPGDLATVFANPEKAKRLLSWEAQYGIEEMCRDAWAWQSQNPNGYR